MGFDVEAFLTANAIEYAAHPAKNVKAGCVGLRCVFCFDDPSNHLNWNLEKGNYFCFRDRSHCGGSPVGLVKALLGCSWDKAKEIVGEDKEPSPGSWEDVNKQLALLGRPTSPAPPARMILPSSFKEIERWDWYWQYVARRKFRERDVLPVTRDYQLRAGTGDWDRRLILPFLDGKKDGKVLGWTGRAISSRNGLRYLSHPSSGDVKRLLFNYGPALEGGEALFVVEGAVGSIKLDYYGRKEGFRSVGLLGAAFTAAQVGLICRLSDRYKKVVVLLDPGAEAQAVDLLSHLTSLSPVLGFLPNGLTGPDDLAPEEVLPTLAGILCGAAAP